MTGSEIREKFLVYFKNRGHTILPGSSLIPSHDPTLLFTNAGMVQFKDIFTGKTTQFYPRAATCQKCVRAGGKHNDLENVGHTARHHTFFEMLGNFSFGDYFKKEAIRMAWEFLTDELGLPKGVLYVTVFREDEEAFTIWEKGMGIPSDHIFQMGEKDNFWAMGDTGPCGPCSEILIDQGPEFSCGRPDCQVGCDCDRYLELWNLVFMQFERQGDGKLLPLPKPSIDTGMGLERITTVLQGGKSNYDSDLFTPLVQALEKETDIRYGEKLKSDVSFKVICDHIRAITFLLGDGVLPSNEGRGYVLRRILRRAARHGKLLHIEKPFLCHLVPEVIEVMQGAYPELEEHSSYIATITSQEEERFHYALDRGLGLLTEMIESTKKKGESSLPGEEIFRLYDTFGFPLDLTQEILAENTLSFDQTGFEKAMEKQRDQARKHWQGSGEKEIKEIYKNLGSSLPQAHFLGYESLASQSRTMAIIAQGKEIDEAREGQDAEIILDQTPFYAEKGGQIGDTGILKGERLFAEVKNTLSFGDLTVHRVIIKKGGIKKGDILFTEVDRERRMKIALNHTATHLLHAALKNILGDHVRQAGSLVAAERLRFDFTHFSPLNSQEIQRVEEMVNEQIRKDNDLDKKVMELKQAIASGATALFGEKYQEQVRVVDIADFSSELCGGIHCQSTGQIGLFIITSETGIAAGVRRIEAITGSAALNYFQTMRAERDSLAQKLKAPQDKLDERVDRLLEQINEQEKEIKGLVTKLSHQEIDTLLDKVTEIDGMKVLACRPSGHSIDIDGLRQMADILCDKLNSCVIVLATEIKGKAHILVKINKELSKKVNAVTLVRSLATHIRGSGGGRPEMAQAGGANPGGIEKALQSAPEVIKELLQQPVM